MLLGALKTKEYMKKIVLAGLEGKMGSFLLEGLQKTEHIEIVAGVGQEARLDQRIPMYNDLNQLLEEVEFDVYVDFTVYEFARYASEFMLKAGKPIVIGTTGFSDADIDYLKKLPGRGVIAPNFSVGAVLLNKFAQLCTHYFENFSIYEYHHSSKKDNPSGTALYIANTINEELKRQEDPIPVYGIRLPGVLASHYVIVSDETQKLELIHQSNNRHSFEQGVILAITKMDELDKVIYGLEHLIES